jgi:hypothetical protein
VHALRHSDQDREVAANLMLAGSDQVVLCPERRVFFLELVLAEPGGVQLDLEVVDALVQLQDRASKLPAVRHLVIGLPVDDPHQATGSGPETAPNEAGERDPFRVGGEVHASILPELAC